MRTGEGSQQQKITRKFSRFSCLLVLFSIHPFDSPAAGSPWAPHVLLAMSAVGMCGWLEADGLIWPPPLTTATAAPTSVRRCMVKF